ncbi:hypothetical protein J6590_096744 [Homalodisca vitripennis]|nr:hypothetical protein J6590_096744 [Homalodisca vitripennis]
MSDDDSSICSQDVHYLRDLFTTITEFDDYQRIDEEDLLKFPGSPSNAHNKVQYQLSSPVNKDTPCQLLTENLLTSGPSDVELMGLCENEFNRCFEKRVARSPVLLVSDIPLVPRLSPLTHTVSDITHPKPLSLAPPVVAEEPGLISPTIHFPVLAGSHVTLDPLLPSFPVLSDLPEEMSWPPSQQWGIRRPLSDVPVEPESPQQKRRKVQMWSKKVRTGRREIGARVLADNPIGILDFTRNPDLIERVRPPIIRCPPRRDNRTRRWLTQDLNWDLSRNEPLRLDEIFIDGDEPMEEVVAREQPRIEEEPIEELEQLSWSNIVDTLISSLAAHPLVTDINYMLKDVGTSKMPYIENDGIEEEFPPDFRLKRAPLISSSVLMRYPDWATRGQRPETHDEVQAHSAVALHQTDLESGGPPMPEGGPTISTDIGSRTIVQQMQDISVTTGPSVAGSAFSSIGSDLRPVVPDVVIEIQGGLQEDQVPEISDVTMATVIYHPLAEETPTVEQPMPPEGEVQPVVAPGEMPPPPPPPPRRPRRRNVPRIVYTDGAESPRPRRRRRPRPLPEREPPVPQVDQSMEAVPQPPFLQDDASMAVVEAAGPAEQQIMKTSDAELILEMRDTIPPDIMSSKIWTELRVREVLKEKVKIKGMVLRFSDCCEVGVCDKRSAASFFSVLLCLYAKKEIQLWQTESSGDPTKIFIKLLLSD